MVRARAQAIAALVGVLSSSALGCAGTGRARRFRPALLVGARFDGRASARPRSTRGDESAVFIEHALHRAGLRFGTDGSVGALWGYLRTSHELIEAADARPGDVVFFDTRGTGPTARTTPESSSAWTGTASSGSSRSAGAPCTTASSTRTVPRSAGTNAGRS